jgi:hypothetical protein
MEAFLINMLNPKYNKETEDKVSKEQGKLA